MNNLLQINGFAVIGSEDLGTKNARLAVSSGYEVKIFDSREGVFGGTFEMIPSDLQAKRIESVIPWEQQEICAKAIWQVKDMGEVTREAELIIEAAPENLEKGERGRIEPRLISKIFERGYESLREGEHECRYIINQVCPDLSNKPRGSTCSQEVDLLTVQLSGQPPRKCPL